jgi:hypothetical protein
VRSLTAIVAIAMRLGSQGIKRKDHRRLAPAELWPIGKHSTVDSPLNKEWKKIRRTGKFLSCTRRMDQIEENHEAKWPMA